MERDKLDQRLLDELGRDQELSPGERSSSEEMMQKKFQVSIELIDAPDIPRGLPRPEALKAMETQVDDLQRGLVDDLGAMGVEEIEKLIFSNSLSASLTLDQIQEIAQRPEVKIIRLVKVEKVTTDNSDEGGGIGPLSSLDHGQV